VHLGGPGYFHRIAEVSDAGYAGLVFKAKKPTASTSD